MIKQPFEINDYLNGAFTSQIQELEFEIEIINGVYFANMGQEPESERRSPPLFVNGEWEINSLGGGGNKST